MVFLKLGWNDAGVEDGIELARMGTRLGFGIESCVVGAADAYS
jgi:hypothetical protein